MQPPQPDPSASNSLSDIAPKLAELSEHVLFEDIWERPRLSKRDGSLITIAALTVLSNGPTPGSYRARPRQRTDRGRSLKRPPRWPSMMAGRQA